MGCAAAAIPAPGNEPAPVPAPGLDAPVAAPAPAAAVPCVWRIAFRPPARLYYGCRSPESLTTFTDWIDLDPERLGDLASLAKAMAAGEPHEPIDLTLPATAAQPRQASLCDRYWLWADDEGPRAPAMTRARKIEQACAQEQQKAAAQLRTTSPPPPPVIEQ
jgi:hypothetical protein